MNPTIYDGDTLLVSKSYKSLKHEEIVILYNKQISSNYLLKRVIAIEGDYLYINKGEVFVNGKILREPYIKESWNNGYYSGYIQKGYVYVMGDNRDVSFDSRNFGLIKIEQVKGKVLFK